MSFLKIKIRTKLSAVFIAVVLLVVGATTFLWFTRMRTILQSEVKSSQNQIGHRAAEKVDEFIRAKVRALIIHSQSAGFLTQDLNSQKIDLTIFLSQDRDVLELIAIDKNGMETIKTRRDGGFSEDLVDKSRAPSFIANTFRYSKEYIGEVEFNEAGEPTIVISVPIKTPVGSQNLSSLSTESTIPLSGSEELVLGVLEAKVSLKGIFNEITDLGVEEESSVVIVDKTGRVIAARGRSPDIIINALPPIAQHIETIQRDPFSHTETFQVFEYLDEKGTAVLGSHSQIENTNWAIVIEQPTAIAYENLNRMLNFSIILMVISIGLTIPISYLLAKRITRPVVALTVGANKISQGNLHSRIEVDTDDELEEMARAFNNMTAKLEESIRQLQEDKDVISAEKTKLEVVLSGVEDAVFALDAEKRVVLVNTSTEKLLNLTKETILGKTIDELFGLFDKDQSIPSSLYVAEGAGILYDKDNITLKTAKGIEKKVNVTSGSITEGSDTGVRYILTINDITEKQKLEDMKVDFVSMAAHELRTPLTSVRGYLAMFLDDYKDKLTVDQLSLIENANTASNRLHELVESLLELTRMERKGLNVNLQKVDWKGTLEKNVAEFQKEADEHKVTLTIQPIEPQLPFVKADELRIGEVLSNLLSNAIKYTNEGGSVTVSTRYDATKNMVITDVVDTGIGIPKNAIASLFTKFFRVPGKLELTARGTGLGLYIAKQIVTLHNGDIWVESEEGKGSTFSFSLPAFSEGEKKEE